MRRLSLIGVLVLAVGMVVACGGSGKRAAHNAKCPFCSREFTIPQHGGDVQWIKDYRCPNCGLGFPAGVLYENKQNH